MDEGTRSSNSAARWQYDRRRTTCKYTKQTRSWKELNALVDADTAKSIGSTPYECIE